MGDLSPRPDAQKIADVRSTGFHGTGGDEPSPEQRERTERWVRRRQEPENEVPVPVALSPVVVRTDDVAVVLSGFQAFTSGFAFTLSVLLRHDPGHRSDVFGQVAGHAPSGELLLLGLELTDGRRASSAGPAAWAPPPGDQDDADDALVLVSGGGGGGGRRYDQRYWVAPLPPPGPVRFVVRWDAQGVPESAAEVDGAAIAAAGAGAQELWPWEPEAEQPWEPSQPDLPDDGWFSRG